MRTLRLLLWFVVGLMLSTVSVFSYAETIPASGQNLCPATNNTYVSANGAYCSGAEICIAAGFVGLYSSGPNVAYCGNYQSNPVPFTVIQGVSYTCPTGQNWTLSGSSCTRPDCVVPQARDPADGVCKVPPNKCAPKKDEFSDGWVSVPAGAAMPVGVACLNGCEVKRALSLGGPDDGMGLGKGVDWWPIGQTFTGETCTGVDIPLPLGTDPAKVPPKPAKKPVCAAGEGVMTSSSGKVLCVPEGVPDVSKPVVRKSEEVQTFPDGSTKKTTTTTTTDPNTGAKDVQTTAVSSGGQAGTAGTTTTNGGSSSDGDGDGDSDGDCDPTLQMCGKPDTKGMYDKKETTFGSVLGKFTTDMQNTPFGQGVQAALNITVPSSGACPDLSTNIPYLNTTIDLAPYLCTGKAIEYMQVMGTILKICVGYIALTWVLL